MNKYFIFLIHDKVKLFKVNNKKEEIKLFDGNSYTTYKYEKNNFILLNNEIPYVYDHLPASKPITTINDLSYRAFDELIQLIINKINDIDKNNKEIYVITDVGSYNNPLIIELIKDSFKNINKFMGIYTIHDAYFGLSFYLKRLHKKPIYFFNELMASGVGFSSPGTIDDVFFNNYLYQKEIESIYYDSGFNIFFDEIPTDIISKIIMQGVSSYLYGYSKDIIWRAKDREFIIKKEVFERIFNNVRYEFLKEAFESNALCICLSNNKILLDLLNKNNINCLHQDDYDLELLMDYISIIGDVNNDNKTKFFIKKIKNVRNIHDNIPIYLFLRDENLMGKDKIEMNIMKLVKRIKVNETN